MVIRFIIRALFAALGLWLATRFVPGVRAQSVETLVLAAILLGVVNAFVRPVVLVLTLPLTIVTLGLFLFVINGLMLMLVGALLKGFNVNGLWSAILGSIVVSVVVWIGSRLLNV